MDAYQLFEQFAQMNLNQRDLAQQNGNQVDVFNTLGSENQPNFLRKTARVIRNPDERYTLECGIWDILLDESFGKKNVEFRINNEVIGVYAGEDFETPLQTVCARTNGLYSTYIARITPSRFRNPQLYLNDLYTVKEFVPIVDAFTITFPDLNGVENQFIAVVTPFFEQTLEDKITSILKSRRGFSSTRQKLMDISNLLEEPIDRIYEMNNAINPVSIGLAGVKAFAYYNQDILGVPRIKSSGPVATSDYQYLLKSVDDLLQLNRINVKLLPAYYGVKENYGETDPEFPRVLKLDILDIIETQT